MTKTKIFLVAIVALVIGLLGGAWWMAATSQPSSTNLGGTLLYDVQHFVAPIHNGYNDATIAANGVLVGNVSSSIGVFGNRVNGNGLFVGAATTNYDITQVVFATSTFATTTFGNVTQSSGTIYIQMAFPFPGLGTDDVCMASLNSAPTSSAFTVEAYISQATSTTATSSILMENGTSTNQTVGAGMLTVMCFDPSF